MAISGYAAMGIFSGASAYEAYPLVTPYVITHPQEAEAIFELGLSQFTPPGLGGSGTLLGLSYMAVEDPRFFFPKGY